MTTFRNPATERQKSAYIRMCLAKEVMPIDVSTLSFPEMSKEMDRVAQLDFPLSQNQFELLRSLCDQMTQVKLIHPVSDNALKKLSRSKASEKINSARALIAQHQHLFPPDENQIERLMELYQFPSVDWESYGVQTKVFLETYDAYVIEDVEEERVDFHGFKIPRSRKIKGTFVGHSTYRLKTRSEFREELMSKLSHDQASRIIDRYREEFNEHRRQRISPSQKNYIRDLEGRMANLYIPKKVEVAQMDTAYFILDNDGHSIECDENDTFSEREMEMEFDEEEEQYVPKKGGIHMMAYAPLSDEMLDNFTRATAREYIDFLQNELVDRRLKAPTNAQEFRRNEREYESEQEREKVRSMEDEESAYRVHFEQINQFMYELSRIVGHELEVNQHNAESLRHHVVQVFFEKDKEKIHRLQGEILDFISTAIDKQAFKVIELFFLADRSQIASEIIDELCNSPKYAPRVLSLLRSQI